MSYGSFLCVVLALVLWSGTADARPLGPGDLDAADRLVRSVYKDSEPGAAVIVVKDGKVLLRRGYGLANVELGVPVAPDMVFRIGSITKQITAVAVLMLAHQGKLGLEDEITKFLPDYPTGGRKVTVHQLLTHTSGIKNFDELPELLDIEKKDFSVPELIALFKDKPFDFEPGRRFKYSNSGYMLLGAIIEKASGLTYEKFVEERIFKPLGMAQTQYEHNEELIPKRVPGYAATPTGYVNASYLSMTVPYAAGALVSSVDDLARWDAALYTDKLVPREWLDKAFTGARTTDGKPTHYGYGWSIGSYKGHRSIEHDGGINGFGSDAIRLPDDRLYIAVLQNSERTPARDPDTVAFKVAALLIGEPIPEAVAIKLPEVILRTYAGIYRIDETSERTITFEGGQLYSQRTGGEKQPIFPLSETEFFFKNSQTRLVFRKDAGGKVSEVAASANFSPEQIATLTDKPL